MHHGMFLSCCGGCIGVVEAVAQSSATWIACWFLVLRAIKTESDAQKAVEREKQREMLKDLKEKSKADKERQKQVGQKHQPQLHGVVSVSDTGMLCHDVVSLQCPLPSCKGSYVMAVSPGASDISWHEALLLTTLLMDATLACSCAQPLI